MCSQLKKDSMTEVLHRAGEAALRLLRGRPPLAGHNVEERLVVLPALQIGGDGGEGGAADVRQVAAEVRDLKVDREGLLLHDVRAGVRRVPHDDGEPAVPLVARLLLAADHHRVWNHPPERPSRREDGAHLAQRVERTLLMKRDDLGAGAVTRPLASVRAGYDAKVEEVGAVDHGLRLLHGDLRRRSVARGAASPRRERR